ncbi:ComEC/Rec2 family competence protein [Solwaraspora sp. WMMD406]|uniref:ComEC/Rec2 family competence protein n=1 Tax=Solwaraspora sp. WMMD406 TaxID=3016095 RepID=UPI002415D633|nr:ComEC/Rec2 family competence protein [Solwaraspora sp. WMMD406]MDG4764826.1 ComEC/Rec2 family competence protein [Solwaraspora sp. WMMD406]
MKPARRDNPPPDLRLAGFAIACWLTAFAVVQTSTRTGLCVVGLAAAVAVVTAGWLRRVSDDPGGRRRGRSAVHARRHGWLVVAVALGVLTGGVAAAARVVVRDAEPIAGLVRDRAAVTVVLVIRDDPRQIRSTVGSAPLWLVTTRLVDLTVAAPAPSPSGSSAASGAPARPGPVAGQGLGGPGGMVGDPGTVGRQLVVSPRLLVLGTSGRWEGLLPGQRVRLSGRLAQSRGGDLNAGVLSSDDDPRRIGEPNWAQRAAGTLRTGLQRACASLPGEPGGLLPGLVVGDTSRLSPEVEEDFRATGLTHLVAVSGSNVAIIVGFVLLGMRWCRAGPWLTALACAIALVGFVILARPSPSVVRAATMGAIGLLALATGRPRAAIPALAAAIAVLVVVDPQLAVDAGFALSVMATGGLLLLAPRWRDAMVARGLPTGVAEALTIPAAAQLACTPVVAGLSGVISLVAVPANLLVVPAIAPATVLGVGAAILSLVWPTGAEFVAWLGHWPAWWLVLVARYGAQVPAGSLPWPDGAVGALSLAGLTVLLLIVARRRTARRLLAVVAVAALVGALPIRIAAPGWPPDGWVVAVCAVGQGDAVVLPAGADAAVVIDAGPDPSAVDRCLRRLGVRRVPVLIVSHFHADHVAGMPGVLRDRRVGAVVTTPWPEPAAGRDAVHLAAVRDGVGAGPVQAGWTYRYGDVELTVLGPTRRFSGTRSDPNNNSLMVLAVVRGVRILLTGDAEHESQRALLDRYGPDGLRAHVLKVAHHGSAFQEPAFLDAVRPAVALVPVGVENRYGHPNPAVLARLAAGGARVLRTDLDGELSVVYRDGALGVANRELDATDRAG